MLSNFFCLLIKKMQILALFLVSMIEEDATILFETVNDDVKGNDELYTVDLPEPSPTATYDLYSDMTDIDLGSIFSKLNYVFASQDEHEENIVLKQKLAFVLSSYYDLAAEYSLLCQMFFFVSTIMIICSCIKTRNTIIEEKTKVIEEKPKVEELKI